MARDGRASRGMVDDGGQRREIVMILQHAQCVAQLVQLRFSLFVAKKAVF